MRRAKTTPDHPSTDLVITGKGDVRSPELARLGVNLAVEFGEDSGGRLCIRSIEVSHPEGVTGNLLRQLPLAQIETQHARTIEQLDQFVKSHNERDPLAQLQKMLASLPDPTRRRDVPERFYELVAAVYLRHISWGKSMRSTPSLYIATETGTPLPTVQGWVHRARVRGHLPPARRGAAG
jgi:hypothetical protein